MLRPEIMKAGGGAAVRRLRTRLCDYPPPLRDREKISWPFMAQGFCSLARRERRAYPAVGSVRSEQRSQRAKDQARNGEVIFPRSLRLRRTGGLPSSTHGGRSLEQQWVFRHTRRPWLANQAAIQRCQFQPVPFGQGHEVRIRGLLGTRFW